MNSYAWAKTKGMLSEFWKKPIKNKFAKLNSKSQLESNTVNQNYSKEKFLKAIRDGGFFLS